MDRIKVHIRHFLPAVCTLFIALIALPVQAAGNLCLNVASYPGTYTLNLNSMTLSSPDLSQIDEFQPSLRYDKWFGSRVASLQFQEGQWQLSVFDLTTRKKLSEMIRGKFFPGDDREYHKLFGWSADGKYIAVQMRTTSGYEMFFFSSLSLKFVRSISWQLPETMPDLLDVFAGWSPQGHRFAKSIIQADYSQQVFIWSPDSADVTLTWDSAIRYGGGHMTLRWSPDGHYLAINDDINLRVLGLDGKVHLTDAIYPYGESSEGYFGGAIIDSPVWLSDSKTLLYAKPHEGDNLECVGASLISYSFTNKSKKTLAKNFLLPVMYSDDLHYAVLTFTDSDIRCRSGGAPSFPVTYRILDLQNGTISDAIYAHDVSTPYPLAKWSPNNQMVALLHDDQLILSPADGYDPQVIKIETGNMVGLRQLKWSANSEWVVYPSKRIHAKNGEVYDLGVEASAVYPSPDGSSVAVYIGQSLSVVNNSKSYRVNEAVASDNLYPPVWSSDGTLLAYIGADGSHNTFHVVQVDGIELFKSSVELLKDNPLQWTSCK